MTPANNRLDTQFHNGLEAHGNATLCACPDMTRNAVESTRAGTTEGSALRQPNGRREIDEAAGRAYLTPVWA